MRLWAAAAAAVLGAAIVGVVLLSGGDHPAAAAQGPAADTVKVERGALSAMVSQGGTLTYRARSDGSPYPVINQARGVYTSLPENGDKVACGDVLYRVDEKPVVLLCGAIPAYRDLRVGERGKDVRQLNRNLRESGSGFTSKTSKALERLQRDKGMRVTGKLALGEAVFVPEPIRIAKVTGLLGESARPGAPLLQATSDTLHVQVNLDPSQQGDVKKADRARITLPGNTPVTGRVEGFGRVAEAPAEQGSAAADATIPTFIRLDDPALASGLDKAPVDVDITTKGVDDALSVPVTALVGTSGGGYAVEVVRAGSRRELVAVQLGLFDTGNGRVQVEGRLTEHDVVVVPSI
ncbi:efflux RND transporter periplasmic adaptor subunit [Solirubrobacter soli]|uniref:efflux RND transporter periplasmic adaptor subunit n=1 Tax=Solirubrobacter soli TaxID=363832 RepID=UPI000405CACA|nr:efflux RND transporter periplasmic adaptor subunit [Solirubrobacter soli]